MIRVKSIAGKVTPCAAFDEHETRQRSCGCLSLTTSRRLIDVFPEFHIVGSWLRRTETRNVANYMKLFVHVGFRYQWVTPCRFESGHSHERFQPLVRGAEVVSGSSTRRAVRCAATRPRPRSMCCLGGRGTRVVATNCKTAPASRLIGDVSAIPRCATARVRAFCGPQPFAATGLDVYHHIRPARTDTVVDHDGTLW